MDQENRPMYLYRGVCIPYDKLDEVVMGGIDLVPPNSPSFDEQGRKIVLDGNEYGVYMTDNERMVKDVYGNVHNDGTPIQSNIVIGLNRIHLSIPDVAVSYLISTDGIPIRRPRITSTLQGHYNNGYAGDEWIADMIPADKYKVTRIRIGQDFLHDYEDVEIINEDSYSAKEQAKEIIEMRRYRLESLADELSKMSDVQRRNIGPDQIAVLRDIFGPNGVRYININSIDVSSNLGKIQYLLASFYNKRPDSIDYKTLGYIETLKQKMSKLSDPDSIDGLSQIIIEDLRSNDEKRSSFIQRRIEEGVEPKTDMFDNKNFMLNDILSRLGLITSRDIVNNPPLNPESVEQQETEQIEDSIKSR